LEDGTAIDIIISSISVLARMNLGQLLEAHLGWAAQKLDYTVAVPAFEKIEESRIWTELERAGLPASGKVQLFDGRTGEAFEESTVVGISYMLKLSHMVEDKTHARSTGPYSLVTQQPLGGKAQMGGQRLGEMEVWALEAHRAAHILQEMLTIKSDDVRGRANAFEAMVKGEEIPAPSVPESFKVLMRELNSLALKVVPIDSEEVEEEEIVPVIKPSELPEDLVEDGEVDAADPSDDTDNDDQSADDDDDDDDSDDEPADPEDLTGDEEDEASDEADEVDLVENKAEEEAS
jgi:DNA-directed RNA polymerase subunit beta